MRMLLQAQSRGRQLRVAANGRYIEVSDKKGLPRDPQHTNGALVLAGGQAATAPTNETPNINNNNAGSHLAS